MNRKDMNKEIGIPQSTLSGWANREEGDWRRSLYCMLLNIPKEDALKYISMGDVKKMTLEEMDEKIALFMSIEPKGNNS